MVYHLKWDGGIEMKIITKLIDNSANNHRMNTRKLWEYVYGKRSSTGFWKFIGRLEEKGFVKMAPNQIVLTPLGHKTFYKELWDRSGIKRGNERGIS